MCVGIVLVVGEALRVIGVAEYACDLARAGYE